MKIFLGLLLMLAFALPTLPAAATTDLNPINYCAGELTYDLPDGWTSDAVESTQYGLLLRASSRSRIIPGETIPSGEAVVIINIISRESVTAPLGFQPNGDLMTILRAIVRQAPAAYQVGSMVLFTGGIHEMATVDVHGADTDLIMYAIELSASEVGIMVFFSASGEMGRWRDTAFDIAETMQFGAPRFPTESDEPTFPVSYSADDCSIAFAHPEDWTVVRSGGSRLLVTGMVGEMGEDQKQSRVMTGEIRWSVPDDEVCEYLEVCDKAAIVDAPQDDLLDALEAYYSNASGRKTQRLILGEQDVLQIRATSGLSLWIAYVMRAGDGFLVSVYRTAKPGFTEYDLQTLDAVTNTMYLENEET